MMDPHPLEIASLGAAGEVTGSCFRFDTSRAHFLVDCGMFQGGGDADAKNAAALPFDVAAPDFVILTHVHIDHSGLLPVLHARGFRGPVYATPATIGLLGVMLPDSAHIQEKEADAGALTDARRAETGRPPQGSRPRPGDAADHRHAGARRSEHDAAPLYTVADAEDTLRLLTAVGYGIVFEPKPSVRFRFRDAGHILGAAIIELWLDGDRGARKFVFSGDLGQPGRPVMSDPTPIASADVLVGESTYGNRLHKSLASTYDELAQVLASTLPRGTS